VAATDTVRKPSIDTMAYMVLDTTTNIMWHYKKATSNAWLRVGGSITSGLTGVLPLANGGTGSTTQNFVDLTTLQTVGGAKTFTSAAKFTSNVTSTAPANATLFQFNGRSSDNIGQVLFYDNAGTSLYTFWTSESSQFVFGTNANIPLIFNTNNIERMRIASGGEVFIAGTTDRGAYNLQVNGTGVWGEGAYVNGSDANIKENIIDLDSSLNIVNNLKPVVFNYINASVNNDTKHLGFIAQDVYQTLENKDYLGSIVRSDGDTLSIAYSNIIPLLTKAIQEQQALIKALEQRIINLENK
jgi:hypothetical protein